MTTAALIGIGSANHILVQHEFSIDLDSLDSSSDYISPKEQDDALLSELSQHGTKNKVGRIVQDHHQINRSSSQQKETDIQGFGVRSPKQPAQRSTIQLTSCS
jgi:hypothetical protein